jgi:hypothetical protein
LGVPSVVASAFLAGGAGVTALTGPSNGVGLFLCGAEVLGLVQGYGEVVLSERGWRAEFARVIGLFRPTPSFTFVTARTVEAIAARYGVPIIY